jgi:phosphoribosylformylglycinamidine cyclo-ligase
LIRKVLEVNNISLNSESVKDALLTPTRIYVREVLQLLKEHAIKGMAHITGGGMTENIPRILPQGMGVTIHKGTWNIPKEMTWLQDIGQISEVEMYRTFNMGIGFIMVVDPETAAKLSYSIIGEVTEGQGVVYQ